MHTIANFALAAAKKSGWHVFPLEPFSKHPRTGLKWGQAATANVRALELATWHEGENYGIACKPSKLVVIDLDIPEPGAEPDEWHNQGIKNGWDMLALLAEQAGADWPATFTVTSPAPGGAHLYFTAPPDRKIPNRPIAPLIDTRAAGGEYGGYVVGPGSVLDERAYPDKPWKAEMVKGGRAYEIADDRPPTPLPSWLADLINPPRMPPQTAPQRTLSVPQPSMLMSSGYAQTALLGELETLRAATAPSMGGTGRNNQLNMSAMKLGQLAGAKLLPADWTAELLMAAGQEIGLSANEVAATIKSGFTFGLANPRIV